MRYARRPYRSGFPRDTIKEIEEKICYKDNLVVKAESFHLWVIEKAENMTVEQMKEEFPAEKAGLHVLITDNEKPYHARKVTLLNGPHTVLSPVAFLSGVNIVRDACEHPVIGKYVHKVQFDELMQTLDLPMDELQVCFRRARALREPVCGPSGDQHYAQQLPQI